MIPPQTNSNKPKMQESTLITTFEMLIDQLGKLQLQTDKIQNHLKNQSRYIIDGRVIQGDIFDYPFNIQNYGWHPAINQRGNGGHIVIQLKDIDFTNTWLEMWKLESIKLNSLEHKLMKFTYNSIPNKDDFHLLASNMQGHDNFCVRGGSKFDPETYKISTNYSFVEDYFTTNYIATTSKLLDSPFIWRLIYVHDEIRLYFGNFTKLDDLKSRVDWPDYKIDRVINYLLKYLTSCDIQPNNIESIIFTSMERHVFNLLIVYDNEFCDTFADSVAEEYIRSHGKYYIEKAITAFSKQDWPYPRNVRNGIFSGSLINEVKDNIISLIHEISDSEATSEDEEV